MRKKMISAGSIIDEMGFKGTRIRNARVSEKHANFIVNTGNASAKDVIALIEAIKDKVKGLRGINLELEIKIIGDNNA